MAGAILVSEKNGVSFKSLDFDYIIEKIRAHFNSGDNVILNEIYSPVDEGGMSFISLVEQTGDGFNAFFRAASLAYGDEIRAGVLSGRKAEWDKLLIALRSDSRINSN